MISGPLSHLDRVWSNLTAEYGDWTSVTAAYAVTGIALVWMVVFAILRHRAALRKRDRPPE